MRLVSVFDANTYVRQTATRRRDSALRCTFLTGAHTLRCMLVLRKVVTKEHKSYKRSMLNNYIIHFFESAVDHCANEDWQPVQLQIA